MAALVAGLPAAAEELRLALPVDCALGETCHVQQYVDRVTGPEVRDFACGTLANDGHKGTDFALPSEAAMEAGVAVLAAAPGIVARTRDGVPDARQGTPGAPDVTGRECGNGVVLSHGAGWETQYCHLREGSVAVARGERVTAGTPLGLVGMSGAASFPHLHVSVRHEGRVVDPFRPGPGCGAAVGALWDEPIAYEAGGVISAGLAEAVPAYDAIKAGLPEDGLSAAPPAVVLWVFISNGRAGDTVTFEIAGPDGPFARHELALETDQPFLFRAFGRRAPLLPEGDWHARASLRRDGEALDTHTVRAAVP